jgi:hypothetical protein
VREFKETLFSEDDLRLIAIALDVAAQRAGGGKQSQSRTEALETSGLARLFAAHVGLFQKRASGAMSAIGTA